MTMKPVGMCPSCGQVLPGQQDQDHAILTEILQKVSLRFGVSTRDLWGTGRARRLTGPRQVVWLMARRMTRLTLQDLATMFGLSDHTSVMSGIAHARTVYGAVAEQLIAELEG